ncbi:MAG: glycosyltransferase, partial [Propionibacteriaceae bacterium]
MAKRVLILSASVGSGHNMAAAALEAQFQERDDVGVVTSIDVLEATNEAYRAFYDDAYFKLVKATPWLVGWGYDAGDPPFKLGGSISLWDRINTTDTVRAILDFRPTTVVCTHFLPLRLVALLEARGSLNCSLSAVTTDYDFQGLWLTGAFNRFFVAREETRDHLAAIGVPEDRLVISGIPVRAGLDQPVNAAAVRQRYGLDPLLPTLLISAGAAGGPYITSIVQQVLRMRNPCQAIVVCGRNEQLRADILALVNGSDRFTVLGFTTDMPDLMRVSTLFVGKPGGLSSSECMAAGLPMVLIKPIPGQEV